MTGNDGKLDCQLVIEMIGRTWDRQFAQNSSQPDGPLKGAGGYIPVACGAHRHIMHASRNVDLRKT